MTKLVVYGEGGKAAYLIEAVDVEPTEVEGVETALRGAAARDPMDGLEAAGSAITDVCSHLLGRVRSGLQGTDYATLRAGVDLWRFLGG